MDTQTNIQFEPMAEQNNIQVFSNPQFGEIRTTVIDGEPWFVGNDVARALGYEKPLNAISTHVDDGDTLKQGVIDSLGRNQQTTVINESGLYALIFGSRLDSAKQFKRWVTSEVLPSIRKHGVYLPNLPDFNDPAAAARAWADEVDAKRAALQQLKAAIFSKKKKKKRCKCLFLRPFFAILNVKMQKINANFIFRILSK